MALMKKWRLLDTGARPATDNVAIDSALLKARSRDASPDTLHLLQYSPAAVLVGYFQSVGQEAREDFCRSRGIEIQRRITGGGALYFDSTHLGWEIIARKADIGFRADDISLKISQGVIAGLELLGVKAAFRPRNDIEVNGRKISGTGGVFDGDALLFQGTLLVDLDVESMIKALRIPTEKLSAKGLSSARERVTSLKDELGRLPALEEVKSALRQGFEQTLGVSFTEGGMNGEEMKLFERFLEEHGQNNWINLIEDPPEEHLILRSALKTGAGLIRTAVSVDARRGRLKYALITGDFFVNPARTIFDLEAALKNISIADAGAAIDDFFAGCAPDMMGLSPADFREAVESATAKIGLADRGIGLADANSVFTVNGSFEDAVETCSLLLLPYCAKKIDCEFREVDGCDQCGECSVGDAYAMAEGLGLDVITIHNYEHLRDTLAACRDNGTRSYVGCCCEAFFVKHQETFREAGLPAALIDIEKDTCYQLEVEEQAYTGQFENQTELKLELLEKVLGNVRKNSAAV
ncbi:MAG: DUF116 domain-containing protein [Actinobacteria bacterium]|nr:DUF116 domain-containing protein [Actinomycetota bacterium]